MLNTHYNKGDAENNGFDTKTGLPMNVKKAMERYAKELVRKNPRITPQECARRVRIHFNLQVVNKTPAGSSNTPE